MSRGLRVTCCAIASVLLALPALGAASHSSRQTAAMTAARGGGHLAAKKRCAKLGSRYRDGGVVKVMLKTHRVRDPHVVTLLDRDGRQIDSQMVVPTQGRTELMFEIDSCEAAPHRVVVTLTDCPPPEGRVRYVRSECSL